jgi:GTP 3',8-cyclase
MYTNKDSIQPLDKKSLRDSLQRPLLDLRLSVIDACNFRCSYCMPGDRDYRFLDPQERLSFSEIMRLSQCFSLLGVRKLRITGGEPLLRKDLAELVASLAENPDFQDLSLTTNGFLLEQQASKLKKAGLHRVTISLDTLDPKLFQKMSGKAVNINRILRGIYRAREVGLTPIKINAVVKRGVNENGILELAKEFRERDTILRFIEYMDVGNQNNWNPRHVVPSQEVLKIIHSRYPLRPIQENYYGEVANRYAYEDEMGEIGFISSVTQPFCSACTRARLSANGKFYTCLFSGSGLDLLGPLRAGASDLELTQMIETTWKIRRDQYSEERQNFQPSTEEQKVEMFQVGG